MTRDLPLADPAVHGELPPEQLDAWMDLLVDGEVREPQRQALLSRLERLPDGWRRCALAFLESQAWREALDPVAVRSAYGDSINEANSEANSAANPAGINLAAINLAGMAPQLTADAPSLPAASAPSVLHPRMAWRWQPWLGMVAAAASFVIAFGLGSLVQRAWFAPGSTGEGVSRNFADGPPGAGSSSDDPRSIAAAKQPQWGTVRLAVDGPSGAPQQVHLLAVDGPDPEQWLREQPPAIPDDIVQALRQHGHHVQTQRRYVPIPLDDGRNAVFPFDQVDVRFRGGNGYQ